MPDKLCRTCGGDLIRWSTCTECRKVIQKICRTCCVKTAEEFHFHPEQYLTVETKSIIATVQSYSNASDVKKYGKNHHDKNHIGNMLVVFGIITGVIVLGISGVTYLESSHNHDSIKSKVMISSETPTVTPTVREAYSTNTLHPSEAKPMYSNCIGMANGVDLTITCPTEYGNVYKAVVEIPSELVSQFENNVFTLRDLSVIEHMDSISVQYAKRTYESKFINS